MISAIFSFENTLSVYFFSSLAALLPIIGYILLIWWMDRYEREPITFLFLAFLLGAIFPATGAYFLNTAVGDWIAGYMNYTATEYTFSSLVAPIQEEILKALTFWFFWKLTKVVDNVTDGMVYGAVIGLGFSFSENILYYANAYYSDGEFYWLRLVYLRGFFTSGLHASATAILCAFLSYTPFLRLMERFLIAIIGGALAIMVHSFWNSILTAGDLSDDAILLKLPFFALPFLFVLLFFVFQLSLFYERAIIRNQLKLYSQKGLLPEDHIEYITSYLKRSQKGWLNPQINRKAYISMAIKLAFRSHEEKNQNLSPKKKEKIKKQVLFLEKQVENLLLVPQKNQISEL